MNETPYKFGIWMEGFEDKFAALINELAKTRRLLTYVEIGIASGATFRAVSALLEETGSEWRAFGIDPNPRCEAGPRQIILAADSEVVFSEMLHIPTDIDLCLIDGCHSEECTVADFRRVEPLITRGGYVLFHDASPEQQGSDNQPHCNKPIAVRSGIDKLGLWRGRKGWLALPEWVGDRSKGCCADMAVFQRAR